MKKKITIFLIITLISINVSWAQCAPFTFQSEKWSLNIEGGAGTILLSNFGNGWEVNYGGGVDWAPFRKVMYFFLSTRHVQQFLHDNTPDHTIFTSLPTQIDMHSNLLRFQFGMKLRFDWWFKKVNYEGIHPFLGVSYSTDRFLSESTELTFNSYTERTNQQFSSNLLAGEQYEVGFSWVFNDNIKWDLGGYIYDQVEYYSILKNGVTYYPSSKLGLGINTGVYLRF